MKMTHSPGAARRSGALAASAAAALLITVGMGITPANAVESAPEEGECLLDTSGLTLCADTAQELADELLLEHGIEIVALPEDPETDDALQPSPDTRQAFELGEARSVGTHAAKQTFLMGAYWAGKNYAGKKWNLTTQQSPGFVPCAFYGNFTYGRFGDLTGYGNDDVESVQSYGQCAIKLFVDTKYRGSMYGPTTAATTLGAFNNMASSIEVVRR
ncbi:hypothetical protein M3147_16650 [Agromyces mediolanus]|uniref:hypothetical protein n=1 Tax=Agromyces mediolanus TaxID=41986 RepID=UPI00203B7FA9|nr:hypothetical protein [Agromyces mediolanus]MCM3658888.1 hypothetical protein [Agromyces mediolanus]